MQPDCSLDGVTRRHLAQQRAEHTRQHVTAAALGHTGITGTQHGRVPVRECTDRLRPFAHDSAAVRSGKSGRRLCPAGRIRARKPGKLPVVRREDDGRAGALEHRHILRDGKKLDRTLTKQVYTDENGKEYEAYGFTYGGIVEATPLLRLQYSWYQTMDYVRIVRLSLQMLLSGAAGVNDLSGPVGIVSTITEVGKETEAEAGFGAALESILYFAAMFAVNLAVMNLLPLPALDGGHVLFLLVNGIAVALFKKEIPSKYLNVINGIGFALLMALMLFVTFHDIVKLL